MKINDEIASVVAIGKNEKFSKIVTSTF